MHDQDDGVDPSIHLEPIEPFAFSPLPLPPRRRKLWPYLLIAGAIVLSLSSAVAILTTVAARINAGDENVSVTQQRDPASERAEAAQVFRDFDATRTALLDDPATAAQRERGQIESFFRQLESFVPADDTAEFRAHVDFDRMIKRIELTGNLWRYSAIQRRFLRTELKLQLLSHHACEKAANRMLLPAGRLHHGRDRHAGRRTKHRNHTGLL